MMLFDIGIISYKSYESYVYIIYIHSLVWYDLEHFKGKKCWVVHIWALPKPERFLIPFSGLPRFRCHDLRCDAFSSWSRRTGDQALWSGGRFFQIPGWSRYYKVARYIAWSSHHWYIVCWWELRSRWVPNFVKWVENSKWVHHEVNWLDFPYHPFRSVTKHRGFFFEVVRRGGVVFLASFGFLKDVPMQRFVTSFEIFEFRRICDIYCTVSRRFFMGL